ncbi:hypothetical protein [Nocardioides sp.]|uniref:hypothetical protein n=1 Tax=Nocardioides sp. TaxID=35761 RepID=UPI0019C01396|nr:hypothetical protein [Nocardioides sp.]MBC7279323.1 hypothetical protein [Nocardioides sp.]
MSRRPRRATATATTACFPSACSALPVMAMATAMVTVTATVMAMVMAMVMATATANLVRSPSWEM